MLTKSPIVPVAVVGAEDAMPLLAAVQWLVGPLGLPFLPITPTFPLLGPLGLIPLPSKWLIRFGEPLDMAGFPPEEAENTIVVNRLTEQVRDVIQQMLSALLEQRKARYFG